MSRPLCTVPITDARRSSGARDAAYGMMICGITVKQPITKLAIARTSNDGALADATATLPYGADHLADFEQRYCYDRFWSGTGALHSTRYLCNGHALVVIGRVELDARYARFEADIAALDRTTVKH